jgi:arginine repressor
MARGWESKSVEQQQDLARERVDRGPALTPEQAEAARQLETLRLARVRVEKQMAAATNPRYRQTLELELKALDAKIAEISGG